MSSVEYTSSARPVLDIKNVVKLYPGTRALDSANFNLLYREVHAIVGENGAGKSTLAKIISGAQQRTSGTMLLEGQAVDWRSPAQANRAGIAIVHQELDLIPTLTGAENIFLGQNRFTNAGILNWSAQRRAAQDIIERLDIKVPLNKAVRLLSVAEQQLVTIAKAFSGHNQRVIIMDEPTSALAHHEIDQLFAIMRRLKDENIAFIYISHHLSELFQIADRVTVMRDGRDVLTSGINDLTKEGVAEAMVGRGLTQSGNAARPALTSLTSLSSDTASDTLSSPPSDTLSGAREYGETLLHAVHIKMQPALKDVSFSIRRGEILGFTGLMGCGNMELAKVLFGIAQPDSGTLTMQGKLIRLQSPLTAIQHGITLVPEDRKTQGLIPRSSIAFNISLPIIKTLSRLGIVNRRREKTIVTEQVAKFRVRTSGIDKQVRLLSGGNQQKVILSKSLISHPQLLLLLEPTRGVDVGAKAEIHEQLLGLADAGLSLLVFGTDLPELLTLCDRIFVMERGRIQGEFAKGSVNQTELLAFVIGSSVATLPGELPDDSRNSATVAERKH